MTELDEKGLERAAKVVNELDLVHGDDGEHSQPNPKFVARKFIEAYLELPKPWPTDESIEPIGRSFGYIGESARMVLRRCIEVDPIHQAAVAWVQSILDSDARIGAMDQRLIDAVKEAGLA